MGRIRDWRGNLHKDENPVPAKLYGENHITVDGVTQVAVTHDVNMVSTGVTTTSEKLVDNENVGANGDTTVVRVDVRKYSDVTIISQTTGTASLRVETEDANGTRITGARLIDTGNSANNVEVLNVKALEYLHVYARNGSGLAGTDISIDIIKGV
jgi:hypothetical protein